MNIEISQELLKRAISEVVAGAIEHGVASYEIKSKIADCAKEAVEAVQLPALVHGELVRRLDREAAEIARQVAEEVIPALRVVFATAFRSALVAMVYGLRSGKPSYMSEQEQQRWAEISRELMPSGDATNAPPAL